MNLRPPVRLKNFTHKVPITGENQNPKPLESPNLFFESVTTKEIVSYPEKSQKDLERELSHFFPGIFSDKKDWEYMVRHFFYCPRGNTIRQAVFLRDEQKKLRGVCAFDHGVFEIENKATSLIYIHIRAFAPQFQAHGLGRVFSQKILTALKPDMLMTTCVQLASLYSWINIKTPDIQNAYNFFPRIELGSHGQKTIPLPPKDLDFTLKCFKKIYKSHVKENSNRLADVVKNITVHLVRKGVDTYFDSLKWNEKDQKSIIAKDLGISEKDAVLLVIKKIK